MTCPLSNLLVNDTSADYRPEFNLAQAPHARLSSVLGVPAQLVSTSRPASGTIPHYAAGGGLFLAARITYGSIHLLLILNSLAGRIGELKRLWLAG